MTARLQKTGIFGCGRLGSATAAYLKTFFDMELSWILDKGDEPPSSVDAALDASVSDAVAEHLDWAIRSGTNLVIGTTGWDSTIMEKASEGIRSSGIGVLIAPNFSLGAALVRRIALVMGGFAGLVEGCEAGISERHHKGKKDAPSGTAKSLAAAVAQGYSLAGAGSLSGWTLGTWEQGKVPISSLRCGSEIGWHEVRLEAPCETICVTHEADSRDVFAVGAVRCLRWINGRKGIFTFDDMAGELIGQAFGAAMAAVNAEDARSTQ